MPKRQKKKGERGSSSAVRDQPASTIGEDNPVADKAMFSFIVNRQFHSMTIFQLNFISREAKQARIGSPVLRYAVRVISSVIYGKTEPAAVTKDELALRSSGWTPMAS
ncbi:hypothetical protein Bca52824_065614 [Brassica carinata]|uniref:Arabidopsis retrotransposon Orf1 C-terminal domain-containing protein n=1 Tax=Brassica carinata TaxID=52824 RepID=A0A8X7QPI7_BRACI|nr:hypothetical protein Bca52824_065614 [Brassica carinata]